MGRPLYTNNAATYLAFGITNTATTMQVSANAGSLFPNPTGGDYFYVSLISLSGPIIEIVKCTARSGDIFTIERGQEGTTPLYWNMGDNVQLRITAAGMNYIAGSTASTTLEQSFTATQGQTVFTLTNFDYSPGNNNLAVFVNGSKQVSGTNYTETNVNTVTFTTGLNAGDIVEFLSNLSVAAGTIYATDINYNEGSTGAVTRTLESKLQESISVLDFGADPTGVTDSTTAFTNAATAAAAVGKAVRVPGGSYTLLSSVTLNSMEVNFIGDGIGVSYVVYTGSTVAFDVNPADTTQKVSFKNLTLAAGNLTVASGTAISITYPTTASWSGTTVQLDSLDIRSNLTGAALPHWDKGIYLANAWNGIISQVWFSGEANSFTGSTSFIELDENCTDFIITDCHAYFCVYAVLLSNYSEGLHVTDCVFVTVGTGIYDSVGCLGSRISNNHINAQSRTILLLGGAQRNITNNLLYCAYTGGVSVIEGSNTTDANIQGNFIFASDAACTGIVLDGTSTRNNVLNNNIQVGSTGVWLKSTTYDNYAQNNKNYNAGVEVATYLDQGTNVIDTRSYVATRVIVLTGGATSENVTLSIPSYYFFGQPSVVYLMEADTVQDLIGFYEYSDVTNSATSVVVKLKRRDGGTIAAGGYRFSFSAFQ